MDTLASNMADLFAAIGGAGDLPGGAPSLPASADWTPSLLLVADRQGRLIAAEDFTPENGLDGAETLAREFGEQLAQQACCSFPITTRRGLEHAWAVRLPESAGGGILGCLVPATKAAEALRREHAAWVVSAAAACAVRRLVSTNAAMATRIEHLRAEQETLHASHTEAITLAIEEREERLRQQEEYMNQLQAVMMMAADAIITTNEQGIIDSFNEAAADIFGYIMEEVVGQNIALLIPSAGGQPCWCSQATGANHAGSACETIGRRKNGETFPVEIAVSEVGFDNRRIFTIILRDVTARKRAEEELRRLHLQNQLILNSAGEGIFGLDRDGRAIFVNAAAAEILGWRPEELIGRPMHEVVHDHKPDGSPCRPQECRVYRTLRGESEEHAAQEWFSRKNGASFPVEYTCTPIRENGAIMGAVLTFRDTSEKRRLEAQLRQAQKLESIGQLAAGIAHEINTPTQYIGDNTRFLEDAFRDLTALLNEYRSFVEAAWRSADLEALVEKVNRAAQAADVDYLLEEIPKAIQQSIEGVNRVAKIVRSMKEFSHPGGEEKQAIDLNRAIESTLTVSRNEWKYVAEVDTDFDPNLPPVPCYPSDLNQVVLNLIVNAAHAIADQHRAHPEQKGTITVRTRREGDQVAIFIADTGTGIPEHIRSKVYDPFFTTKEVGRGTGQGLAIAHSVICEKHGGSIDFTSEMGKGTTFVVRLPLVQEAASAAAGGAT